MRPHRNVPVVITTRPQENLRPSFKITPRTNPPLNRISSTAPARMVRLSSSDKTSCMELRYRARSAWARSPRTAGPLRRFSMRNWIPAASATLPISPSRASISRTRCPLPNPPMAGLQDISPMVSRRCVSNKVRAPKRAAAAAASQPA